MQTDLAGRVAFVTGGAGAIGRAICALLAENGARVVVADINVAGAETAADTIPGAIAVPLDVRSRESAQAAVAAATAAFGGIDILVNNAGVNTLDHRVPADAFPHDEWERITAIDLDGPFVVSRAALPSMLAGGGGRVVNIASVVGLVGLRLQSPFSAAKAGLIHLTRSMALELGPRGVNVNAIAPGSIMSELTRQLFYGDDGLFSARTAQFLGHVPLGRPGRPEEIAEAALFLAAPENSFVNGHILTVDGGWTAGFMR